MSGMPVCQPASKREEPREQSGRCRVCRCTHREPCNPPCSWDNLEHTLCSTCALAVAALVEWAFAALNDNIGPLVREFNRQMNDGPDGRVTGAAVVRDGGAA
jgi:hypothetical protein